MTHAQSKAVVYYQNQGYELTDDRPEELNAMRLDIVFVKHNPMSNFYVSIMPNGGVRDVISIWNTEE